MTCQWPDKQRHATEGAAWVAVHSLRAAGKANQDVRPYRCRGHWHVGHSAVLLTHRIRRALRRSA